MQKLTRKAGPTSRSAFTLVEVIVIVTILGVIAAVVATRLTGAIGRSKAKMASANAASLYSALEQFRIDHGDIESGDTIDILWERPGDVPESEWEPYVKNADALLDPWGNKYVVRVPGDKNPYDFDVISYGADGQPGGEGDNADIIK